jgi:hypothetical protein
MPGTERDKQSMENQDSRITDLHLEQKGKVMEKLMQSTVSAAGHAVLVLLTLLPLLWLCGGFQKLHPGRSQSPHVEAKLAS